MRIGWKKTSALILLLSTVSASNAWAERSLDEHRHFRAIAIDLLGRMPTLEEVDAFEKPEFNLDQFIDKHLDSPEYADRLLRVYMDLLRLEPGPNVNFGDSSVLYRKTLEGPDGKDVYVYYRKGQRRSREETDGDFCIAAADLSDAPIAAEDRREEKKAPASAPPAASGKKDAAIAKKTPPGKPAEKAKPGEKEKEKEPDKDKRREEMGGGPMMGPPKKHVTAKALEQATVLVKPWWLYKDYEAASPKERFKEGWKSPDPAFQPVDSLLMEPDKSPTEEVRVCREEAQSAEEGHIHAVGARPAPKPGEAPPFGRMTQLPRDSGYATAHRGESIHCSNKMALASSVDCGCGVGLDRCVPSDAEMTGGSSFMAPQHEPIGILGSIDAQRQQTGRWYAVWWAKEAQRFFQRIFREDRDFREVLTSHSTFVNGPLAQFYKSIEPEACCGQEASFGMTQKLEPLFNPVNVPKDLSPQDASKWELVPDRGPHAAGILTMPIFLEKFASRRARAAAVYQAFLCKSFSADTVELTPSAEPNLMVRPGCSTCHATLEPLAAYFARVEETGWVYLPPQHFPLENPTCKNNKDGKPVNGACNTFYDPDFGNLTRGLLRGAYGSPTHANEAPEGAARDLVASPDFAKCVAQRVTASFLGRNLGADDQALLGANTDVLTHDGFKLRQLVKAVLKSDAYARANNLSATTWRGGGQ